MRLSEGLVPPWPEIRVSAGTAQVLGLIRLRTEVPPTTGYFLLGERCLRDCAFCAQARSSQSRPDLLSRVVWPSFPLGRVLEALERQEKEGRPPFHRICLQVVLAPEWRERVCQVLGAIKAVSSLPVSVSCEAHDLSEVEELFAAGAARIGLPLDVATPRLFTEIKGGSWEKARDLLKKSAQAWPGRISTHLIVGLGETEQELAETMAELVAAGVTVGLFAFTPLRGTRLKDFPPPSPGAYRRMQVVRYLLSQGLLKAGDLVFDHEGRLVHIRRRWEEVAPFLAAGDPFRTSGCPDCNRPYYNERPGGVGFNFPRPLTAEEVRVCLEDLNLTWEG